MLKPFQAIHFIVYYFKELVLANIQLAKHILGPKMDLEPGFLKVELRTRNSQELLLFANLITMTPGTMAVEVSEDQKWIYIHTLFAQDPEKVRQDLFENLQGRVTRLLRWAQ
jgi:multicomponent Na+:H+ antiporter subunit E